MYIITKGKENSIHSGAIMKPWILLVPTALKMENPIWHILNCNMFSVRWVSLDFNVWNISSSTFPLSLLLSTAGSVYLKMHVHTDEDSHHLLFFCFSYTFFKWSKLLEYLTDQSFLFPRFVPFKVLQLIALDVCYWFEPWVSPVKTIFVIKKINQHKRPKCCLWEKSKSFWCWEKRKN